MNLYEFIIGVMIVMLIGTAIRGGRRRRRGGGDAPEQDEAETLRLRREVETLRERLAVIERITVEKESSLEREIEQLRDR